ncbi:MAG: patatin family protein [Bacteroidales bacterium]|nr:patatin family protein [Candidatus Liminaster caballi]
MANTGLVLEGGGMRGLFTSGILDVLLENGVKFPFTVGVSAGACFGVNYKSHQIGRALRYNVQMCGNPNYMSMRSWLKTGEYINSDFCYHVVPTQIDVFDWDTYAADPMKFHIVCTDIETGRPYYHDLKKVDYTGLEWIRASASLPIVSKPVELDGRKLMDGGLSDSLPLRYAESQGYERNVVILTQPLGYRKKPMPMLWLYKMAYSKYPNMIECLRTRHDVYNAQLEYVEQQAAAGKVLLIAPPHKLDIGRVEQNPEKLKAITQLGRETGLAMLERIKEFLK